jgi:hypothetical protein
MVATISGSVMLAACGGGSGGSGAVAVVPAGTATPTPTPTPAATPTSTPTPTPTPTAIPAPTGSYARYADLTGDRTFQTACASLILGSAGPTPQPALPFGDALTLGYTAATSGWAIGGDGTSVSFTGSDSVAAAPGQTSYARNVAGSSQNFTIAAPVAGGAMLDYTRSFALRTDRAAGSTSYSCVFGVPSLGVDVPTTATTYSRIAVDGTAYLPDASGTVQSYVLSASTGSLAFDPARGMVVSVHLLGNLRTASGVSATSTDLGTFTGTGAVDAARIRFAGSLDGAGQVSLFSSFAGAFFGGTEAGSAFEILAADAGTGARVTAVGTITASR